MNITKNVWLGVVLAGSVAMSVSASAGGYLSGSVGKSDLDIPGIGKTNSYSVAAGYALNENFAVEASFQDFGSVKGDGASVSADGISLALIGSVPVTEQFGLRARIGLLSWDAKAVDGSLSDSLDGSDMFYGVGAAYNIYEAVELTLNYDFYELDGGEDEGSLDVDNMSIGVKYSF